MSMWLSTCFQSSKTSSTGNGEKIKDEDYKGEDREGIRWEGEGRGRAAAAPGGR